MRRPPGWWPEGEEWPPRRPPWRRAPAHFRRRFVFIALGLVATLVAIGFVLGGALKGGTGGGPPWDGTDRGGPGGLLFVAGFVALVGGVATVRAYRRIGRPVAKLVGAAERVAAGDYGARVEPDGPRELRALMETFNDMAAGLAASDEQRRRFLADVTHELRTPLAVLQSGLEAQLDGIHERDDRHVASLLEETQRLGRLVDDLHTLALTDAGTLRLHREPADPSTLVAEVLEGHAAIAARKGIALVAEVALGVPEVDVDPARVHQVLANLISNALRHTPPGGSVRVAVTLDGGEVAFAVTDTGPGFPPESLDNVFDRFTRASDAHGSGLGLSIAHDLVEAHGGTITATNLPEGGASIRFVVPLGGRDPLAG